MRETRALANMEEPILTSIVSAFSSKAGVVIPITIIIIPTKPIRILISRSIVIGEVFMKSPLWKNRPGGRLLKPSAIFHDTTIGITLYRVRIIILGNVYHGISTDWTLSLHFTVFSEITGCLYDIEYLLSG